MESASQVAHQGVKMGTKPSRRQGGRTKNAGSAKPSLDNLQVVEGLVRSFGLEVIDIRARYFSCECTEPVAEIERLAAVYGDILMGRSDEYLATPYNSPRRMGLHIAYWIEEPDLKIDPGKALFVWLAKQVVQASIAVEGGRDEAEASGQLDSIFKVLASRCIGPAKLA